LLQSPPKHAGQHFCRYSVGLVREDTDCDEVEEIDDVGEIGSSVTDLDI
jgi:hypothetical protein